jgi:hypothetical protein
MGFTTESAFFHANMARNAALVKHSRQIMARIATFAPIWREMSVWFSA